MWTLLIEIIFYYNFIEVPTSYPYDFELTNIYSS